MFQRNAAKFYGANDQWENKSISSQGSIFQKNAAVFYGIEAPKQGERPFQIKKPTIEQVKNNKGFSVINDQKVREHVSHQMQYNGVMQEYMIQRDPKYQTSKGQFYGLDGAGQKAAGGGPKSTSSKQSKISDAQRLDAYIQ